MPAPPGPPTGTVTFLFSDVQGSTRLWEDHPEPMREALARHDALLIAAIAEAGGHVFKTGGDAFFAAFDRPEPALRAALAIQRALQGEPWGLPGGQPLRVRLALHTGAAELRGGDYFGGALSRAARLLGAAHGGQTLVSEATAALVTPSALPPGASLRSLNRHRLKDLSQPQEIYHLVHPDLPADFPPPRSLEAFQHNLPAQLTSFVGREAEMEQAQERLRSSRLLTLTGTGGSGKSRLAVQVAADALDDFPDGAWLVELAPLTDPDLVSQAVAGVLGLGEEPDRRLMQTLTDALRARTLLLVLDNCEHLIDACARLAETLLRACPGLRILATSREALGIGGEAVLPLSELGLPPAGLSLPSADVLLAGSSSVRLFVERATSAQPLFRFSDGNARAVSQVCACLGGNPLALELAAARVKVLSPEQLSHRLEADGRFRLLTGGSRTALPRQQTLRALIDWSYDLLPSAEQALFRRLSVFSGGWTLEAVEAVCAGGEVEDWEVLDLLSHLVAKSLVVAEPPEGGQVRYRLLENLRQYSRERLDAAGEGRTLAGRHRDWFLAWAEEAEARLSGPEHARRLDQLERDHDNLRLALATSRDTPEQGAETFLRLAGALHHFWAVRSYLSEGRGWLEAALAAAPDAPPAIRAKALNGVGVLAWSCGDVGEARAFHEADLALRRAMEDRRGAARALANLGILAAEQRDFGEARRLFEECLAVYREMGDRENVASMLNNLGAMVMDSGDAGAALPYLEESLGMCRSLGNSRGVAAALNNLGVAWQHQERYPEARRFFCESLLVQQVLGDKQRIASTLSHVAQTLLTQGDLETAAVILAASENVLRTAGVPGLADEQQEWEKAVAEVRGRLSEAGFAHSWERGRGLGASQAIAFVLEKYGLLT